MLSNLKNLLRQEWWRSMFGALLRTLIAGVTPFMLAYTSGMVIEVKVMVSTVLLLLVVTILTSLTGIPTPDTAPYWQVIGARFLRQFAQFLIAGIGTAILFSDVPWLPLLLGALASAVSTALIGSLTVIPGSEVPVVVKEPPTLENPPVIITASPIPDSEVPPAAL